MKKLFVLFLLVALVPFTVGCSLWGGDDEAVTYPLVATASVFVPADGIASLRGAAAPVAGTDWANYVLTVNGVTLNADTYEAVGANVKLTFKAIVSQADKNKVEKATGLIPVVISNGTVTKTTYVNIPVDAEGVLVVTVDATGAVTAVEVDGEDVPADNIAAATFEITSVKIGELVLGNTATNPASATTLFPVFTVTLPEDVTITDGALPANNGLSITTKNAAGTVVAIAATDFTVAQGATSKEFTVTVKDQAEPKRLNDGTVYSVTINNLKINNKVVVPETFFFVVDLP